MLHMPPLLAERAVRRHEDGYSERTPVYGRRFAIQNERALPIRATMRSAANHGRIGTCLLSPSVSSRSVSPARRIRLCSCSGTHLGHEERELLGDVDTNKLLFDHVRLTMPVGEHDIEDRAHAAQTRRDHLDPSEGEVALELLGRRRVDPRISAPSDSSARGARRSHRRCRPSE
jgi:hypothetical protein